MTCEKCKKNLDKKSFVVFDKFGELEEPMTYCYECFAELISTQYKYLGDNCEKCGAPLELKTDDLEEDIEEKILWYCCKKILEASDPEEYDDHDSVGEYVIQPEADWE
ncbi:hypothetical protein [Metabacillus halosaccharovorans]|uniref:Uncharacterized protein n=1 Tax=Metabacillus halosaccharovorans TaxID=930124 RepID=A0ABT3DDH2_9BACI|nr:hypothetical protein [Metabacillus halosaccharovorans]MCV9885119.1 hypothetical protein [Metabacillus halosaccharovorans]